MKKIFFGVFSFLLLVLSSCNTDTELSEDGSYSFSKDSGITGGSSGGTTSGTGGQAGVLTAGEWNDLDNWLFLDSLLNSQEYAKMSGYWSYFTLHRVVVDVHYLNLKPAVDVSVMLKRNGSVIWNAKTDNRGKAELWVDIFQKSIEIDASKLELVVGTTVISNVKFYNQGVNSISISTTQQVLNNVEIAFMVDATGSMGDELEFLKTELLDVINRAKSENPAVEMVTGAVFYRDIDDEYLTRISNFTANTNTTIKFIEKQAASGGGDFPEAVHTALAKSIDELQWTSTARTRILFMVLDAPPHYKSDIVTDIQNSCKKAAEKGIKIIPITASGIDKETEFLMRFMSLTTNGTYVFVTNDSGVGGDHLQPTVGKYEVEKLNNLLVRLIDKYIQMN